MRNLFILISFSLLSFNVISQQKDNTTYSFKKEGYYYTKNTTLATDFVKSKLTITSTQIKGNSILSVHAFIFKDDNTFYTNDDFYGLYFNKKNNFKSSIKSLENYLSTNASLMTKGSYRIKNKLFSLELQIQYNLTSKQIVKNLLVFEGEFIDENSFILFTKKLYKGIDKSKVEMTEILNKKYTFKPHLLKKEIYLDEKLEHISYENFTRKAKGNSNIVIQKIGDSLIYKTAIKKVKVGRLTKTKFKLVKKQLQEISNSSLHKNKTIVLNFISYNGCDYDGNCDGEPSDYLNKSIKKYIRKIKKKKNIIQFFIYNNANLKKYLVNFNNAYLDKNNILKELFFVKWFPFDGYVIINPYGNYYTNIGEYPFSKILKNNSF
tara:strand:- start:1429 stop:2562 length:1134 start_codon:yes stop_codon:yes gene_type:complete